MENRKLFLDRLKSFLDEEFSHIKIKGEALSTKKSICYTASIVGSKILKGLGYKCDIQRVTVLVGNEIGRKIFTEQKKKGAYKQDEMIKANGWTIGLGVPPDSHYIIYIDGENSNGPNVKGNGEILDLTFGQANRPQHNIVVDAYWENEDSLPETIIEMHIYDNPKFELDPVYYYPEYRRTFKKIIRSGIKILEKEGFSNMRNEKNR